MLKKMLLLMGLIIFGVVQVNALEAGFGPQLGYYKANDADKGSYMAGAAYRMKVTPLIGIEASINYRQEKYANDGVTVRSWPVMVTGLIYPIPYVYGAAGFGWYRLTYDYDQSKFPLAVDVTKQKVGWHFGGGIEVPIGENIKLTGDVRYVFIDYDFKEVPGGDNLKSNFTVFTVGCLFNL